MALEAAAAITIERYWRGYVAREVAGDRREEMLLFLEALKRQEAKTMEREYFKVIACTYSSNTSQYVIQICNLFSQSYIRWRS